jgi:hypothetical protein
MGLWSKYDGQTQYGVCINRMCCPPLDSCWGVFSGEATCEYAEHWATVTRIDTGFPVFGFVAWVSSGSTPDNFSGYGMIYNHGSGTLSAVRWNNQPLSGYGTILLSVTTSITPYDFIDIIVQPAYTNWPSSRDWYFNDNTEIDLFLQSSAGVTKVNTEYIDTSASRFVKQGCGGLVEQGLGGVVVLPADATGDYHGAHMEEYGHECGLCYGRCDDSVGGCLCDNDPGTEGIILRHWDNTCGPVYKQNESPRWVDYVSQGSYANSWGL